MSKFVFSWKIIIFFFTIYFHFIWRNVSHFSVDWFICEPEVFICRNKKIIFMIETPIGVFLLLLFLLLFTLMQKLRIVKTQNVCMQSNLYSDLFQRGTYVIHSDCIWLILIVRSDFTLGSISNKHITWLNANTNAARLNANYGTKKISLRFT